MIKTVLTTTAAFALMTGMAFAQAKTDGGTARSAASPTSASSGVSLSTGQTQPLQGYSTNPQTPGLNSVTGSATGGPGANPNGPATSTPMPTTSSSSTASTMPSSTMPASPTLVANTPTGDAPSTYPKCTHKGQDRCMQRMVSR